MSIAQIKTFLHECYNTDACSPLADLPPKLPLVWVRKLLPTLNASYLEQQWRDMSLYPVVHLSQCLKISSTFAAVNRAFLALGKPAPLSSRAITYVSFAPALLFFVPREKSRQHAIIKPLVLLRDHWSEIGFTVEVVAALILLKKGDKLCASAVLVGLGTRACLHFNLVSRKTKSIIALVNNAVRNFSRPTATAEWMPSWVRYLFNLFSLHQDYIAIPWDETVSEDEVCANEEQLKISSSLNFQGMWQETFAVLGGYKVENLPSHLKLAHSKLNACSAKQSKKAFYAFCLRLLAAGQDDTFKIPQEEITASDFEEIDKSLFVALRSATASLFPEEKARARADWLLGYRFNHLSTVYSGYFAEQVFGSLDEQLAVALKEKINVTDALTVFDGIMGNKANIAQLMNIGVLEVNRTST